MSANIKYLMETIVLKSEYKTVTLGDIVQLFSNAGIESFATGGTSRDLLLGNKSNDIDVSIDGSLDRALTLLDAEFGKNSGVMRYRKDQGLLTWGSACCTPIDINRWYELAADSVFSNLSALERDALTRDFSFNAIYISLQTGQIFDPFNGIRDLQTHLLRLVTHPLALKNNPKTSLRILKFILRGYILHKSTADYLEQNLSKDICVMGEKWIRRWVRNQLVAKGDYWREFMAKALEEVKDQIARGILESVSLMLENDESTDPSWGTIALVSGTEISKY